MHILYALTHDHTLRSRAICALALGLGSGFSTRACMPCVPLEETKEYHDYRVAIEKRAMRVSLPKDTSVKAHNNMKS